MATHTASGPAEPSALIVHLSTQHGWRGGERQVWFLARGLAARGWRQVIAAPQGSPLAQRVAQTGLAIRPLHRRAMYHPGNLIRVAALGRAGRRVIVHAHTSPALTLAALASKLWPHTRIVYTRRVDFPVRPAAKYRRAAHAYVAISHAIARRLAASGTPANRLHVIPSGVDLEALDSASPIDSLRDDAGQPIVGCVAHLSPEKGLDVLLAAWALVARTRQGATLVLVGDGPERPRLEQAASALPAGSVRFAGSQTNVAAWIKAFDVYVQPSRSEGLGSSVLDAMACRVAVVASNTGGLPDAVSDGRTGLLVPPGEPKPLARAILDLLADPARAHTMGQAGRARVESTFSLPSMIDAYARLYQQLAGDMPSRRFSRAHGR